MNRKRSEEGLCRIFCLLCGLLASVTLFASAELPDPVVWFSMDDQLENGQIPDLSGNGRHLTLGSGMSLQTSRVKGRALVSDGSRNTWAYFSCPPLVDRSLSFWFYRNETDDDASITPDQNKYPYLISNLSGFTLMFNGTAATFRQAIGASSSAPFSFFGPFRSQWTHFTFTLKSIGEDEKGQANVEYVCYRNGAEIYRTKTTATGSITLAAATTYLMNMTVDGTGVRPVYGQLDELRVFDVALTKEQVVAELKRSLSSDTPRLIGHWKLDRIDTADDGSRTTPEETGLSEAMRVGTDVSLVEGPLGKGLSFSGGTVDSYAAASHCHFHALLDASIAFWVKLPSDYQARMSAVNYPRLWSIGDSNLIKDLKDVTDQTVKVQWRNGSAAQHADLALPVRDAWSHLVLVYSHDYHAELDQWQYVTTLYVNGKKVTTLPAWPVRAQYSFTDKGTTHSWPEILEKPLNAFRLGADSDTSRNGFAGGLADLRVYQGALSAEQAALLAQVPATVEAGDDFTVTSEKTTLRAVRGLGAGAIAWTCVSGDGAVIENASCAETAVLLPTEGTYVFRAMVTTVVGQTFDEVTVTRQSAPAENTPPAVTLTAQAACVMPQRLPLSAAVSDPDGGPGTLRTRWSSVSGPGAAWFEPETGTETRVAFSAPGTYQLACTASDGAAETTGHVTVTVTAPSVGGDLTDGLLYHFGCDSFEPQRDRVSGARALAGADYATTFYRAGRVGQGFAATGARSYFEGLSGNGLGETRDANAAAAWPAEQYRTISAWIYHDPASTNRVKQPIIVGIPFTFWIAYDCPAADGSGAYNILVQQQGFLNAEQTSPSWSIQSYQRTTGANFTAENQWLHVCVVVDRRFGQHRVYVNGEAYSRASGGACGGRITSDKLSIGGYKFFATDSNPSPNSYFRDAEGKELSRTFPGVVDEVMIWNRALTADEVKRLAEDPYALYNRPPQIVSPTGGMKTVSVLTACPLEGIAYDDALPRGLTYSWELVSGDASAVALADPSAAETSVTFWEPGTYQMRLRVTDGETVTSSPSQTYKVLPNGTVMILR